MHYAAVISTIKLHLLLPWIQFSSSTISFTSRLAFSIKLEGEKVSQGEDCKDPEMDLSLPVQARIRLSDSSPFSFLLFCSSFFYAIFILL